MMAEVSAEKAAPAKHREMWDAGIRQWMLPTHDIE